MRNNLFYIAVIIISLFIMVACTSHEASERNNEITISAAASLKDSLERIQKDYEQMHPDVRLKFNFGGSGPLQQQISQGAPVDLFFSAAENKFTELVDEGLIAEKDSLTLLKNELVLIVPNSNPNNISSIQDLLHQDVEHISIGIPETVPAGSYAKESLLNQELWEKLETKIVYTKDVRQVLSYVETGNVAAGIVYKTDAIISEDVMIIHVIDSVTHSPIHYPVGIIKDSKNQEFARDFYNYLQNDEVKEVFKEYGFIIK